MTREKCEKNLEHGYFNQSDISNNAPEKWRQKHKTSLKWITFLFDYPYFRFISSPQQPLELSVEKFACLRKKRLNTFHFWSKWLSHLFQLSTAVKANNLTHFTIFPHLNPVRSHFPQRNMTHKVFFLPFGIDVRISNKLHWVFFSICVYVSEFPTLKQNALRWNERTSEFSFVQIGCEILLFEKHLETIILVYSSHRTSGGEEAHFLSVPFGYMPAGA